MGRAGLCVRRTRDAMLGAQTRKTEADCRTALWRLGSVSATERRSHLIRVTATWSDVITPLGTAGTGCALTLRGAAAHGRGQNCALHSLGPGPPRQGREGAVSPHRPRGLCGGHAACRWPWAGGGEVPFVSFGKNRVRRGAGRWVRGPLNGMCQRPRRLSALTLPAPAFPPSRARTPPPLSLPPAPCLDLPLAPSHCYSPRSLLGAALTRRTSSETAADRMQ